MNASPSSRRRPRLRPGSPLASSQYEYYPSLDNDDNNNNNNNNNQILSSNSRHAASSPVPRHDYDPTGHSSQISPQTRSPVSQQRWPSSYRTLNECSTPDDSFSDITGSLRPVQAYHNAFANADDSSPVSSRAVSSFSSASRAFIAHHRQQSFPNLLPSLTSTISKNIGRAISPDRSLSLSFRSARPPIPTFQPEHSYDHDHGSSQYPNHDRHEDDDNDADGYNSEDSDGHIMSRSRGNIYTTYTSRRKNNRATGTTESSTSVAESFSNWFSGGTGSKAGSPSHAHSVASSCATTPDPSALRGGGVSPRPGSRGMTFASEASSTPKSTLQSSTSPSRFTQLASSMSATLSRLTQQPPASPRALAAGTAASLEQDEFYRLDIARGLFPNGHPSDRDPFSPSAYKNLEQNASGLLTRFQAAYRQQAVALLELAGEKSARDEELEEAETRAQHLKMQLEGMASKVAEQEEAMKALQEELAAEKKARAQERAMLVSGIPTTASTISEDLGVEEAQRHQVRRLWRKSDGSYEDTDEGDEESAADEDASSVFSRSRSPTIAPSIVTYDAVDASGPPAPSSVSHPRVAALGSMRAKTSPLTLTSPSPTQTLSTFQKLMKNMTTAPKDESTDADDPGSCRNCRGQDVSFAWNTVSILRDENKQLKQRVGQLEVAVDGALDVVNGVGY